MANDHHIVYLDNWVDAAPLNFPHKATHYPDTTPSQLPGHIRTATIIVTSYTPITRTAIAAAPLLQLVACNSTGTDRVDHAALRERGVTLCRVPAQNTASVSEHALALYFSLRRCVVPLHAVVMDGRTWGEGAVFRRFGSPPRSNGEEIVVVVGYGAIGEYLLAPAFRRSIGYLLLTFVFYVGKNIEKMCKALGMTVLVAERKGAASVREDRVAFEDAVRKGTVFMVAAPLDDSSRDMIAMPELEAMLDSAVIINVGRGATINEHHLAAALRNGKIGGAACDTFNVEPATKENCPLLDPSIPNLVLSPHIAWYSSATIKGTLEVQKANIEAFVSGHPMNVVS
ncbi:hypothetical protein LTR62_007034 [Meristemomyces frigidus]|uniref:Glycerate dehydrogenase n=1 Tax=Meristemomyces frigidus TaxID=1508187 RepID=A0AAN7TC15_9PEZI|nr:hypothetical protein LTR62_007034 [Meristemomyces frigidus]